MLEFCDITRISGLPKGLRPPPPVLPTFRLRLSTVVQSPEMTTTKAAAPTFDQGGNLINSCFGLRTPIGAVHIELFGNCEMP